MYTIFIGIIIVWLVIMTLLLVPSRFYRDKLDRITSGRYREDRVNLQVMLDHLRSFPELWSISRDQAAFPKEGAKQIYLNYEPSKGWMYNLSSFGREQRLLDGHYGQEFSKALSIENNHREVQSLLRNFYPGLDGPLLLK